MSKLERFAFVDHEVIPLDLADHIAAEVAAATANYAVADAMHLAAVAAATTANVKTAADFAAAAYATADADIAFVEAQYALADACWRAEAVQGLEQEETAQLGNKFFRDLLDAYRAEAAKF
jgi:hypothetical protein